MMKTLPALLLLAACAAPDEPRISETEFETRIASALAFDPALLKPGQRVVYFVKRSGEPVTQAYSWSCVGGDAAAVWVENKVPFEPRPVIFRSKIARDGRLLEQWMGEPGAPAPAKTYPGERAAETRIRRDSSAASPETKEEPDSITVGGKPFSCTRVTTVLKYPDGRKSTMMNWFSKEVPFAGDARLGGLVKRQFGRLLMELAVSDAQGAREELPLPTK
jgi:hypothetical protein